MFIKYERGLLTSVNSIHKHCRRFIFYTLSLGTGEHVVTKMMFECPED